MNTNYFSQQAARALIGRYVRIARPWSTLPAGATGVIKWIDEAAWDCYGVVVKWDTGAGQRARVDTLTRTEFLRVFSDSTISQEDYPPQNVMAA